MSPLQTICPWTPCPSFREACTVHRQRPTPEIQYRPVYRTFKYYQIHIDVKQSAVWFWNGLPSSRLALKLAKTIFYEKLWMHAYPCYLALYHVIKGTVLSIST